MIPVAESNTETLPDLSVLLLCAENGQRLVRVHDGALGFRATLLLLIVPDGKRMTTF
jgi:hypothetical protein